MTQPPIPPEPATHEPLRVGVVAYELEGRRSGVGRYLEGLLDGVRRLGLAGEWRLYFKGDPFDSPFFEPEDGATSMVPIFDSRPAGSPIPWEQFRLPKLLRRDALDVLVSPGYSLPPIGGLPRMVTLHDLSFEHLGHELAFKERWRRRVLARLAAKRGDRVLADTEAIAADLRRTYALPESKVGIVPLAVDERFFNTAVSAVKAQQDLDALGVKGPYLLHLGTILPRRCLELILEAFGSVSQRFPELSLVLAGHNNLSDPTLLRRWIQASGVAGRVVCLDYVPEARLPTLCTRAEAGLYLSTYEGYGLPPLELLAMGTPVVVSDGLALDDLAPTYPWRTSLDVSSVAATLERILKHEDRAASIAGARQAIRRLTWTDCATRYVEQIHLAMDAFADRAKPSGRETAR